MEACRSSASDGIAIPSRVKRGKDRRPSEKPKTESVPQERWQRYLIRPEKTGREFILDRCVQSKGSDQGKGA